MFQIDGDRLMLSLSMPLDEVKRLKDFLEGRLEYISSIEFEDDSELASSALLQLLFSVKKSRPEIEIPILEREITLGSFGRIGWRV
ncbi:MAG: hypothetical protein ACTTJS_02535 [Wolinella sp.]